MTLFSHLTGCEHLVNAMRGRNPACCSQATTSRAGWTKWLEREFTDRKVRGSNPTFASRLPVSRLGQPGSLPALVQPSGGMAVRHRKGATAGQFQFSGGNEVQLTPTVSLRPARALPEGGVAQWLVHEFTDREARGSNPTQPSRIPTFVLPSGGIAARHRKAERLLYYLPRPEALFMETNGRIYSAKMVLVDPHLQVEVEEECTELLTINMRRGLL
ncbi:hypothetical protein CSKR_110801 [Clonorchis sinensis]|uniref:Uncharacterized protein n=1 Tax=Clonorchis sinensis TaxID=79923 RepID=A0A3R7C910_CLOSI|nr:hypothetical protein CSKR_110801 [Clonorchis sinensis]